MYDTAVIAPRTQGDYILISVVFYCDVQPVTALAHAPTSPLTRASLGMNDQSVAVEPLFSDEVSEIRLPCTSNLTTCVLPQLGQV